MPLTDDEGNELNPLEWLTEAVTRLAMEAECIANHVHEEDWTNTVLHLRQMHQYVPFIAEVIMTTQMTDAQVKDMLKAELQERLGIDLTNVTVLTNLDEVKDVLKGVDDDELRRLVEQQSTETFQRLDEEHGGGWTDLPPVP